MSSLSLVAYHTSPAKPVSPLGVRKKTPSPEKKSSASKIILTDNRRAINSTTAGGSPLPRSLARLASDCLVDATFTVDSRSLIPSTALSKAAASSRHISLPYPLVNDGVFIGPPNHDYPGLLEILKQLFPTLVGIVATGDNLVLECNPLPSPPRPFTIGGVISYFVNDQEPSDVALPGIRGRGSKALTQVNLRGSDSFSHAVLDSAWSTLEGLGLKVTELLWAGSYWRLLLADTPDAAAVPATLANENCFYLQDSEIQLTDASALHRAKVPQGVEYDDTNYCEQHQDLRPGVMFSSSVFADPESPDSVLWKTTTSGIAVRDPAGHYYVTGAAHGFNSDGLVFHPNPYGALVGRVVQRFPDFDVALIELETDLTYLNKTFGSEFQPDGITPAGLSICDSPDLRRFDELSMNNPYTGSAAGQVTGLAARVGSTSYVRHTWTEFENKGGLVGGSCGSPVMKPDGIVVGFFRYIEEGTSKCYAVEAAYLEQMGFRVVKDAHTW